MPGPNYILPWTDLIRWKTAPGCPYYHEITVSGTLDPDWTGVYHDAGFYLDRPYYRRGSDSCYFFFHHRTVPYTYWVLSSTLGDITYPGWGFGWTMNTWPPTMDSYIDLPPATGVATITPVYSSGLCYYRTF